MSALPFEADGPARLGGIGLVLIADPALFRRNVRLNPQSQIRLKGGIEIRARWLPSDAESSLGDLLGAIIIVPHARLGPIDKVLIEQRCVEETRLEPVGLYELVLQENIDNPRSHRTPRHQTTNHSIPGFQRR
jgi:hypothetical protein